MYWISKEDDGPLDWLVNAWFTLHCLFYYSSDLIGQCLCIASSIVQWFDWSMLVHCIFYWSIIWLVDACHYAFLLLLFSDLIGWCLFIMHFLFYCWLKCINFEMLLLYNWFNGTSHVVWLVWSLVVDIGDWCIFIDESWMMYINWCILVDVF